MIFDFFFLINEFIIIYKEKVKDYKKKFLDKINYLPTYFNHYLLYIHEGITDFTYAY